ncbi:MAG TPA: hypothetical protein VFQ39_17785 [Longimicrobium sp.]|nr:hypothetical protein [Longimicrobium sp.]
MMAIRRTEVVFWASAAFVAAVFSVLVPVLTPFHTLGLEAERDRIWMLTVFCAGVMAVLLGLSGAIGSARMLSLRDVLEAGSFLAARERGQANHKAREAQASGRRYDRNFGWWMVAMGGFLLAIYYGLLKTLGT